MLYIIKMSEPGLIICINLGTFLKTILSGGKKKQFAEYIQIINKQCGVI